MDSSVQSLMYAIEAAERLWMVYGKNYCDITGLKEFVRPFQDLKMVENIVKSLFNVAVEKGVINIE